MRAFTVLGWMVAVAAVGAAVYFYLDNQALRETMAATAPALPAPEPAATPDELASLQETVDSLEAKLAAYEKEAQEEPEPVAETESPTPAIDPAALLQGMLARTEGDSKPATEGMFGAVSKMFEGEQGERMLASVAKQQVGMMYGDFLGGLDMSDEQKQAVRDILSKHMTAAASLGMKAMSENDLDALKDQGETAENAMRDELASVLSPAELDAFDAYQETLGARSMAQAVEMQMQFMAPDVTAENRTLLSDIVYEEALASPALADTTPGATAPGDMMQQQAAVYDRVLERASQTMEPEQYAAAEAFIHQQQEMMQSFASAFGMQEASNE